MATTTQPDLNTLRQEAETLSASLQGLIAAIPDPTTQYRLTQQVLDAEARVLRARTPEQAEGALQALRRQRQGILAAQRQVAAKQAQQQAEAARRQRQQRARALHGPQEANAPPLLRTHVAVAAGAEVRIIDALITIVIAALTVLWTATRSPTGSILWGVFWTALGGLMAVEGRGELRYAGFGVSAANAAFLSLRATGIARATGSGGG